MNKNKSDFVAIKTVQGQMTAEIIKSHLENEGIPVYLKSESVGKVYGLILDGLGAVNIFVPQEFVGEAKKIINNGAPPKPEE
jgi:CRISPR/Cas system-associated protein Csm6